MIQNPLLEVPHALFERLQATKQVRTHRALWEAEVLGDLLGAQPLLEAHCYSHPVLAW
jgi:hypothetical protein